MGANYSLDFPINAGNPSPLINIAKAAEQIAQQTKLGAGGLNLFNQALKQGEASGLSFNNNLKETLTQFGKMGGAARAFSIELRDVIKQQERLRQENEASGRSFEQLGKQLGRSGILSVLGGSGLGRGAYPLSSAITGSLGGGAAAGVGAAILGAGSIVAAAVALKDLASRAGEYGREQENLAMKTGLSVTETQLWSRSAQIAGTNADSLVRSMRTLSQSMAEGGAEAKRQKEALAELGLNPSVLSQQPSAALNQIYGRINQLSDPFERERITSNLFGRGGLDQLPLIGQLKGLEDQLRSFGGVMDEAGIHKAAEYKRQMELLGAQWDVLGQKFGQKIIGTIEFLVSGGSSAAGGMSLTDLLLMPFLGARATEGLTGLTSSVGALFNGGYGSFDKDRGLEMYNSRPQLKGQIPDAVSVLRQQRQDQIESIVDAPGPNEKGDLDTQLQKAREKLTVEADKVASNVLASLDPLRGARGLVDALERQKANSAIEKELQSYVDSIAKKTATVAVPLYDPSSGNPLIDQKTGRPQSITSPSPVLDIYAGRGDLVKKLGLNREQASRATGAANLAAGAELTREQDEATKQRMEREQYTHQRLEREAPDNAIRATGMIAGLPEENALKLTGKDVDEGLKRNSETISRNAKDANSLQDALRKMQEESAQRQTETDTRLETSLATSGMTGAQKITTTGAMDLRGAARSRDEQVAALGPAVDKMKQLVDYTAEDFKKIEASAKIVTAYKEQERDIAARTLAELDQERQRSTDSHASTFAAGIMAAATHTGEQFGRQLGRSIGETMLTNFGKNFIFQKDGPFDKAQGSLNGSSTLGKLFQGTGLFKEESPLNAPALKLDTAGDKLNAAADKWLGTRDDAASPPPSPAAIGNTADSFGANVPGFSKFSSSTNNLFTSVEKFFGKHQKYAGPAISGGGTQPVVAPSSIQADVQATQAQPTPQLPDIASWTGSQKNAGQAPLTEQVTSALGGSNGEGLSGRGGFEGIARELAPVDSQSSGSSNKAIEDAVQALYSLDTTSKDLTAAIKVQTEASEYVATGGTVGEMPGGATPPIVTGPTGIPGLSTLGSDVNGSTGGSGAGLAGLFSALPLVGAGVTALAKATGIGVGRGQNAGVADSIGPGGNGAGIIVQQATSIAKNVGDLTKTLAPSSTATFGSDTNGATGDDGLPLGQANSRLTSDLSAIYGAPGGIQQGGLTGAIGTAGAAIGTASKAIGGFAGLMANPFGDKGGTPGVNGQPGVDNGHFSAMGVAAAGADVALGAMTAVQQFGKGGVRGALGGTSAILGTAAALTAPIPVVGEVLGIASMATGLIKSMLGDPRVLRQQQIEKNLFTSQYQAPAAQNVTSSTRGTFADLDMMGNIRQSNLSPYSRSTGAYLDVPFRTDIPSVQTSQFGGGGPITVNNNIAAMDSGSFETFLKSNPSALMAGFTHGMTFGHSGATQAIKGAIGQG